MTPEIAILWASLISGFFSIGGIIYSARKQSSSSTFETLVKAYEAMGKENDRLRDEVEELRKERIELQRQLADCYRTK